MTQELKIAAIARIAKPRIIKLAPNLAAFSGFSATLSMMPNTGGAGVFKGYFSIFFSLSTESRLEYKVFENWYVSI